MTQSVIRKPGAAPGQQILAIDLAITPDPIQALSEARRLGYNPEIRQIQYADGIHRLAVLRDESGMGDELMAKWAGLCDRFPSDAVHLWCGKL